MPWCRTEAEGFLRVHLKTSRLLQEDRIIATASDMIIIIAGNIQRSLIRSSSLRERLEPAREHPDRFEWSDQLERRSGHREGPYILRALLVCERNRVADSTNHQKSIENMWGDSYSTLGWFIPTPSTVDDSSIVGDQQRIYKTGL